MKAMRGFFEVNARSAMSRKLDIAIEQWPMAQPLHIHGHVMTAMTVVVVSITRGRHQGRGEGSPVFYRGETAVTMAAALEAARPLIESGIDRRELRRAMPAGGARNAVDCALWDLASRQASQPVWELLDQAGAPPPLLTTCTLGADTPERMAQGALHGYREARAIKLKLLGDAFDGARVAAVRAARPDVWLGVDANQGLTLDSLAALMPALLAAHVQLIEQPLPAGQDAALDGYASPIPLAADESVQTLDDVAALVGRYQMMNIKLDKCGGLSEALLMAQAGRRLGLRVMVGNMGGTALGMAPALLMGQYCDIVDLDAPLFLTADRQPGLRYQDGLVSAPPGLWGWS